MATGGGINIGRVIGEGLDTLGRNALPIFGLAVLLVGVPIFFLQHWIMSLAMTGAIPVGSPLFLGLTMVLGGMLVPLVTDALLLGFVARIASGERGGGLAELGRSIGATLAMAVPLTILSILVGLIVSIGLALLIVPGVILYLVLVAAVPAMVVERRGVIESMIRSEKLASGSKGMIFLVVLLLYLALALVAALLGFLAPIAIEIAGPGFVAPALTGAATDVITSTINAAILSSLYVELREAKEGSGGERLAGVFE